MASTPLFLLTSVIFILSICFLGACRHNVLCSLALLLYICASCFLGYFIGTFLS